MKTKFNIISAVFGDKKNDDDFLFIGKEINLKEGDRVCIDNAVYLVEWKCLFVLEEIIEYVLIEE